jgi:SAM-dependent methyltransferase
MAGSSSLSRSLNLGCGRQHREGCINVDRVEQVRPDLVWDLDRYPYPLPDSHFERIFASDVIEHLQDVAAFMQEVHRLLVPGGIVEITTPHFSCANSFTDPTHRHHLGYFSLDYFTRESPLDFYSDARFEFVERQIVFHHSLLNRLVRRLAARHPRGYEQRFAWIFPAWFLRFQLRAVK